MRTQATIAASITALGLLCILVPAPKAEGAAADPLALDPERQHKAPVSATSTLTFSTAITQYLPLVARHYALSVPTETVTKNVSYAMNESWSWESCAVAHDGAEWGGWWPGSDKGFVASADHSADHPDYAYWDFYRGYLWATVPEMDKPIISATLRLALCYVTAWPTQTGQVAWHVGTWPQASPLEEDGLEAWGMYEAEPFVVSDSEDLPRAYERVLGGTCDKQTPSYVDVPLPLARVQPGHVLRVLARDGRDAPGCTMEPGFWGTHLIKPETVELRLYVGGRR